MTLQEAIDDIQRQMDTFMTVYIEYDVLHMLERVSESDIHPADCHMVKNKLGKWVYRMRLEAAEEIRDAAREALARQVTEKLTGTKT